MPFNLLVGRNTLSVDELRPEEEGYAWPRRRQRLAEPVDTDFSASIFGNVETAPPSNGSTISSGEGSRKNVASSSQVGSNTASPNGWWTGGATGLQMAGTELFEVEEVPYSSNLKETLRMVLLLAIGAKLIWGSIIKSI